MFAQCQIEQLFPTPVWAHVLNDHQALNDGLVEELHRLRQSGATTSSSETSWQSRGDLHGQPAFQPLVKILGAATRGVLDFLKCQYEGTEITDCWANIGQSGQTHQTHTHPNNYLSGVYYLRAPEGCGDIVFQDPRRQAVVLVPKYSERNVFNASTFSVTPREGTLLMFYSWFQHSVEANRSGQERISIAFNVMLHGHMGYQFGKAQF